MSDFDTSLRRFCSILDMAEERFLHGDAKSSVALAQIAARLAYPANVGLFASPRLEKLLVSIGKSLPSPIKTQVCEDYTEKEQRILHILSYARPLGGDTRFVWRWIQEDQANRHFVAVTTQEDVSGFYEIPRELEEAVENSGGFLRVLRAPPSLPLDQAVELRDLCQNMDFVILHLFPYDVIPILALCKDCENTRTIFVNHSDHTFWIGASISHSIAHLRVQPPDFLRYRRNLKSANHALLPIPLAHSPPKFSQNEAKTALGFDTDKVILLTIASPFKYTSPNRLGLLDLVIPVLSEIPQAMLVAIGPSSEGIWREMNIRTNGRVIALGARYNNAMYYAAADIYLDSVPFSSITSLLEAGSQGLPLLGFQPQETELSLLGPGAPGLDGSMKMGVDVTSYQKLLQELIVDENFRIESGFRVRNQILARHTGRGWWKALEEVYSHSRSAMQRSILNEDFDFFLVDSLNMALVQLYGCSDSYSMRGLFWRFLGTLPYRKRVTIVWELYQKGFDLSIFNLLPSPLYLLVRTLVREIRRWVQVPLNESGGILVESTKQDSRNDLKSEEN